ncbi:hypothetical protein Baya_13133 [Bagarius yarrelli]|uniref:Uncharacterized protein n=1 Tax=Bagarius yarrelli TaxID=175774 RepID=A0A556V6H1_BAGYA|nr:hypothetical protein Baya_13133 [Bagarius yarrelli]
MLRVALEAAVLIAVFHTAFPPHPGSARLFGLSPLPYRRTRGTHRPIAVSSFGLVLLKPQEALKKGVLLEKKKAWPLRCNAALLSLALTSSSILNISSSAVLWIRKLKPRPLYTHTTAGFRRLQLQAPSPLLIALLITPSEPQGNASTGKAGIMKQVCDTSFSSVQFETVAQSILLLAWCLLDLKFSIKAMLNWSSSITSMKGPCRIDLPPAFYLLQTSHPQANEDWCRSSSAE